MSRKRDAVDRVTCKDRRPKRHALQLLDEFALIRDYDLVQCSGRQQVARLGGVMKNAHLDLPSTYSTNGTIPISMATPWSWLMVRQQGRRHIPLRPVRSAVD